MNTKSEPGPSSDMAKVDEILAIVERQTDPEAPGAVRTKQSKKRKEKCQLLFWLKPRETCEKSEQRHGWSGTRHVLGVGAAGDVLPGTTGHHCDSRMERT